MKRISINGILQNFRLVPGRSSAPGNYGPQLWQYKEFVPVGRPESPLPTFTNLEEYCLGTNELLVNPQTDKQSQIHWYDCTGPCLVRG